MKVKSEARARELPEKEPGTSAQLTSNGKPNTAVKKVNF